MSGYVIVICIMLIAFAGLVIVLTLDQPESPADEPEPVEPAIEVDIAMDAAKAETM